MPGERIRPFLCDFVLVKLATSSIKVKDFHVKKSLAIAYSIRQQEYVSFSCWTVIPNLALAGRHYCRNVDEFRYYLDETLANVLETPRLIMRYSLEYVN